MTLMDRKRLTGTRRAHGARGDNGVPPTELQRPAPPISKQAPIDQPGAAGKTGEPAAEREAPSLAWLVLVGATFGVVVLKESLGRIGGPVVVTVKSVPRLPAPFWIALIVGALERIGARVLGIRIGES